MFFIKKVLILFGGNSSEHYISCKSCVSVLKNIDRKRYDIEVAGISKNNIWYKFSDDLFYLEDGSWKDSNILEIDNIIDETINLSILTKLLKLELINEKQFYLLKTKIKSFS